jgi:hypothetical protein
MNGWSALDRFLQTDPRDVGCAQAMDRSRGPGPRGAGWSARTTARSD